MTKKIFNAEVKAHGENKLLFNVQYNGNCPLALYWTKEPDKDSSERYLIQENIGSTFLAGRPLNNTPVYYIMEGGADRIVFGERTLPVEGMNNFRDIGGYIGHEGKRVKWGSLFRSGHFHSVTKNGVSFLRELHIKTIVDFRSDKEYKRNPNVNIGEEKTCHLDPDAYTAELAAQFSAEQKDENKALIESVLNGKPRAEINGSGLQMLAQYRDFVTSNNAIGAFSAMIKVLADGNNVPVVQNCRGGKDRTGVGVMLVLGLLGVSRKDIMEDFMITKENRFIRNKVKMSEYKLLTEDLDLIDYLMSLVETREEYLLESFHTIDEMYGGIEPYAKSVLLITQEEIDCMRKLYLE